MAKLSDLRVVATSLAVSVSDVALNFTIAALTGSTVMLAQGLQGLSDLITGGILYLGVKRSKRQATQAYQFGYGREVFFWVLMAGILMFVGTGSLSVYFGWRQLIHPQPIDTIWAGLLVLVIGFCANSYAFSLSVKRLKRLHQDYGWLHQLLRSSAAETKATFMIDLLGSLSALLGLASLAAAALTGDTFYDGLGSIIIGLCMMATSIVLMRDVRALIVGRAVDTETAQRIIGAAQSVKHIKSVLDLRTMYLGSNRILVILEVHIRDNLTTDQIEQVTDNVKAVVQDNIPEVHHIQVEVETPDSELRKPHTAPL